VPHSVFQGQRTAADTGLFAAPFAPTILLLLLEPPMLSWFGAMWIVLIYLLSLVFVALLGLPTFFVLARFGLLRLWIVLACGLAAGSLIPTILAGQLQAFAMSLYGLGGILSALIFWICWTSGPNPSAEEACEWVKSHTRNPSPHR
jgi:phosphoglycerol transferase MdoB-like AlkP superfamily enzyme